MSQNSLRDSRRILREYDAPVIDPEWAKSAYEQLNKISEKWKNGEPQTQDRRAMVTRIGERPAHIENKVEHPRAARFKSWRAI